MHLQDRTTESGTWHGQWEDLRFSFAQWEDLPTNIWRPPVKVRYDMHAVARQFDFNVEVTGLTIFITLGIYPPNKLIGNAKNIYLCPKVAL